MHSRTKWFKLIPVLVAFIAVALLTGPVLVAENPPAGEMVLVDSEVSINDSDVTMSSPLAVAGTEQLRISTEETALLSLVNNTRGDSRRGELLADDMLCVLARLKAEDMAARGYLSSRSATYGTMKDMLRQAGVEYVESRDILTRSTSAKSAHELFMRNSSSKAIILGAQFDQLGVGVAKDKKGYYYVVEVFVDKGSNDSDNGSPPSGNTGDDNDNNDNNDEDEDDNGDSPAAPDATAEELEMFNLVNSERVRQGAKPLKFDDSLLNVARLKARDIVDKKYFSHTSPTYGSPFEMMKKFGITYSYAGENLAMAPSVSRAHNALMNSSGHRANILNNNFDRVGIGIVNDGYNKYFVQMFTGGQKSEKPNPVPQPDPRPVPQPQPDPQPAPPSGDSGAGYNNMTPDEQKMFQLVNQQRNGSGVGALKVNSELVKLARLKARDMIKNGYFSHTSPTYGSPFEMMKSFGIKYSYAGENLAGASSVNTAHVNLMNSEGHRRNILNSSFTEVGIGVVDGGPYGKMFVQLFIRS